MRILFLTRSFNSLTQRLYLELTALGHEVAVEFDISDAVTIEAVTLFRPALVVAPFLKRAIPEAVWRNTVCLVMHPGIVGEVVADPHHFVQMRTRFGGMRIVDWLTGDQLPRIC